MNHQAARDAAANTAYPIDGKGGNWQAKKLDVYIAPPSRGPDWPVAQCAAMLEVDVSGVEDWRAIAECRDSSPALFFLEKGEVIGDAVGICLACPVRAECLSYALNTSQMVGIWGGLSDKQRRNIRNGRPFIIPQVRAKPKTMIAVVPPRKRNPEIAHGEPAGYQQHVRRGEPTCDACRKAHSRAAYERQKKARLMR